MGVCGPYVFASRSLGGIHNIINVMGVDAGDASLPFNCTKLTLLVDGRGGEHPLDGGVGRPSRTGMQQLGDIKSVVFDANHVLL